MSSTAAIPAQSVPGHPVQQRFYRPELDALRFIAFLCVFICHTFTSETSYYTARHVPRFLAEFFASVAAAGAFGVDLFFLLSAYLITELLLREKEQYGRVHLAAFYRRRILRIWPLYFFGLLIATVLPLVDSTQSFPVLYLFGFLLLCGNWLTSLVGPAASVMGPLWSVSFEEQFYLLWPLLVARVRRRSTLLVLSLGLIIVAQIGRLVLLHYVRHTGTSIFTNTIARLDPLALGILIAALMHQRQFNPRLAARFGCVAAGIVVWLLAGHYYALNVPFMIVGYPAMAIGAALIFVSVLGVSRVPVSLRYLGKISYGLYVFHRLALYCVVKGLRDYPHTLFKFVVFWCMGLALTIAMAAVSYRFYESPFLRLKERFAYVKSRPL